MLARAAPKPKDAQTFNDVIFQIASLELRARAVAEGLLVGTNHSKRFGASTEFAEHKVYAPGDDVRQLDWKAYARLDRYFVRRYEEEANLDVHLVLDASGSMAYAGGAQGRYGVSKLDYARTLAAAIAWLAQRRSDAPGLSVFAGQERHQLPPRARADHFKALFDILQNTEASGPTRAVAALEQLAARMKRKALVVVMSDLLDVGAAILGPLGVLQKRGADVLLLHVMDPDELEFRFDGVVRFEDLEGDREVQVDAAGVRDAYLQELGAFLEQLRSGAAARDLRYHLVRTDQPIVDVLQRALT